MEVCSKYKSVSQLDAKINKFALFLFGDFHIFCQNTSVQIKISWHLWYQVIMCLSDENRWPSTVFVIYIFFCLMDESCQLILMGPRKSLRDIAMNQPLEEFGSLCLLIPESNISVPPKFKLFLTQHRQYLHFSCGLSFQDLIILYTNSIIMFCGESKQAGLLLISI